MKQIALIVFSFLMMIGCASQKAIPKQYNVSQGEKFIPINLHVDAGRYVYNNEARVANYIYDVFEQSNLFDSVETGFLRWPFTIKVKYSWEQPMGAKDFTETMISASTLLLVPAFIDETHTLNVEILYGNETINSVKYSEPVEVGLSLYHDPIEDRKNGMNRLLERFFSEIQEKQLLPKISDIKKDQQESENLSI